METAKKADRQGDGRRSGRKAHLDALDPARGQSRISRRNQALRPVFMGFSGDGAARTQNTAARRGRIHVDESVRLLGVADGRAGGAA
ncbi:hypothetical protein, partial [Brevundimonas diminuta]|uniref:hypothetical protein n=1 Tax=Brevundimonas diminuta TaxID=293 RepID=UPI001B7FAF99